MFQIFWAEMSDQSRAEYLRALEESNRAGEEKLDRIKAGFATFERQCDISCDARILELYWRQKDRGSDEGNVETGAGGGMDS